MQEPTLEPFAVAVSLAALLVGPQLAPMLAGYTLILLGWFAGMMIGVYRRQAKSRMGTLVFVLVMFIVTMGTTTTAAELVVAHVPGITATVKALLFPVAIIIPAIGDNWVDVAKWIWRVVASRLERRQEEGGQ